MLLQSPRMHEERCCLSELKVSPVCVCVRHVCEAAVNSPTDTHVSVLLFESTFSSLFDKKVLHSGIVPFDVVI